MTGASKKDQNDKNNAAISAAQKKRQEAGEWKAGAGTATASKADRGLKRRSE